jgi:hypothetical protein
MIRRLAVLLLASFAIVGCGPECPGGPPLAADHRATTAPGTAVGLSLVEYAGVCGAALDMAALDLDPTMPGAQPSITTDAGSYMLDSRGDVWFLPAPGFSGEATTAYTIGDMEGQVSDPARIVVTVNAD